METLRPRRPRQSGIVKARETLEDVEQAYVQHVLARSPTLKRAATRLGVHPVTLWRMRKRDDFPKPIRLGPNTIAFRKADLDAWLASQPALAS